jgi:hypothetical protein
MGLANTGKKRKSEPQLEVGVSTVNPSTPTQDDEEAPPLPKKKKKKTTSRVDAVESSQLSAMTTTMERNNHGAPFNVERMDNSSKKRSGDDTFVNANLVTPAHPAKKAKVNKAAAFNRTPLTLRRSGKTQITWMLKDT